METLVGRDSQQIKDNISKETSNVDWARVLLDHSTDDSIICVSREKIAHEIIRLRQQTKQFALKPQISLESTRNILDKRLPKMTHKRQQAKT